MKRQQKNWILQRAREHRKRRILTRSVGPIFAVVGFLDYRLETLALYSPTLYVFSLEASVSSARCTGGVWIWDLELQSPEGQKDCSLRYSYLVRH